MGTRFTIDQLERMKTHELADLLANVVLLLRRLPDVECRQLQEMPGTEIVADVVRVPQPSSAPLSRAELLKKTVAELKAMASDLHVPITSKIKKDELVTKLLARYTHSHSEQYAIQDI